MIDENHPSALDAVLRFAAQREELRRRPHDEYLAASDDVAKERVRFAEAFLRFKARTGTSDGQAREQAIVETNDELTRALARQDIARRRLDMGRAG